ncbi:MAG: chlorinating enzyme [Oceanicaulis sp.]|nr:chlorinating enzyme [Oceanicaulis sp.]
MAFDLTPSELDRFDRDGFIGPFDVYSRQESLDALPRLRQALLDRMHAPYDLESGGNIANYDRHLDVPFLARHVRRPQIVQRAASVLGPDLYCWRTEFFAKFPGDEGTDWHQSRNLAIGSGVAPLAATEPHARYPDIFMTLAVWTALTDATAEVSCMQFLPGSHRRQYIDDLKAMSWDQGRVNRSLRNGEKRGLFGYDIAEIEHDRSWRGRTGDAVSVELRAGQCLLFWEATMHGSTPNISRSELRMAFVARYVPTSVRIYPGQTELAEYGGQVSLDRWSPVLVSGVDVHGYNRSPA